MNGQEQQSVVMMKFKCMTCQGEMMAQQPAIRTFNAPDCSALVCVHNRVQKCPHCATAYIALFHPEGLDQDNKVRFIWTPVQTKESAIVPGTQQAMKDAVNATDLVSKLKN